jgi:hypothetical protein
VDANVEKANALVTVMLANLAGAMDDDTAQAIALPLLAELGCERGEHLIPVIGYLSGTLARMLRRLAKSRDVPVELLWQRILADEALRRAENAL